MMCLIRTAHSRSYWSQTMFLFCTDDVPDSYCTFSLVLKSDDVSLLYWWCAWFVLHILARTEVRRCVSSVLMMCLIRTAHSRSYWSQKMCLFCTDDVPDSYCTFSLVLKSEDVSLLYWWCAWFVLHILARTEVRRCVSSVLMMCLIRTAHSHSYWSQKMCLFCTDDVPDSYCTFSLVLKSEDVSLLYWWCAWSILHILACTAHNLQRLFQWCIVAKILYNWSRFSETLVTSYSPPNLKNVGELKSCKYNSFWMYPQLLTSLLVAMHDRIENTSSQGGHLGSKVATGQRL